MAVDSQEQVKTEKQKMEESGGAGVYSVDLWRKSILEDSSWKYDVIPEIMDGHNVIDFVDPEIEKKLEELEKEESLLMAAEKLTDTNEVLQKWGETQDTLDDLHSRMRQKRLENKLNKSRCHAPIGRKAKKKAAEVEKELNDQGKDGAKVRERSASLGKAHKSIIGKRKRDATAGSVDSEGAAAVAARARSQSILKGLPNEAAAQVTEKKRRKLTKTRYKLGKKGEGDHWIPDLKPKHLFSGKMGIGKRDRR
jgi:nucleolar GTP-binding protein